MTCSVSTPSQPQECAREGSPRSARGPNMLTMSQCLYQNQPSITDGRENMLLDTTQNTVHTKAHMYMYMYHVYSVYHAHTHIHTHTHTHNCYHIVHTFPDISMATWCHVPSLTRTELLTTFTLATPPPPWDTLARRYPPTISTATKSPLTPSWYCVL